MAKRKTGKDDVAPAGPSYRLITLDFSAKEGHEIDDWLESRGTDYQPDVVKILDDGWKISFSYSDHYGCYFLSLTAKETGTKYDGYTVSLRHQNFDRLSSVLEYVARIYLADERLELPASADRGSW